MANLLGRALKKIKKNIKNVPYRPPPPAKKVYFFHTKCKKYSACLEKPFLIKQSVCRSPIV